MISNFCKMRNIWTINLAERVQFSTIHVKFPWFYSSLADESDTPSIGNFYHSSSCRLDTPQNSESLVAKENNCPFGGSPSDRVTN